MPTFLEIANLLGCAVPGDSGQRAVTGIASLAEAGPDQLTYAGAERYVSQLASTKAAAAIVPKSLKVPAEWETRVFRVDDAELAVARVLPLFAPPPLSAPQGVDPTARIDPSAHVAKDVGIGPHVVIGPGAKIGAGTILHANVYIGDQCVIGRDCQLFPNVVLRERVTLGDRVVIHAGAVLGTDGFGYRWDGKQHQKVPQIGTVIIEDDVEIGSCTCIDRAKFSTTRIGRGSKIDNLVQIGHNVQTGPHCIIAGQAGLAGSAQLGAGVVMGGQSALRDHVKMADGSMLAACSGLAEDTQPRAVMSGTPALPHRQSLREQGALRQLPELRAQVKRLQDEIDELKKRFST